MKAFNYGVNNIARYRFFIFIIESLNAMLAVNDGYCVGIVAKASTGVIEGIKNDEVKVLGLQFFQRICLFIFGFKGKANNKLAVALLCAQRSSNIMRFGKLQRKRIVFLFDFLIRPDFGFIVGYSSR